jgi:hypothetical protein
VRIGRVLLVGTVLLAGGFALSRVVLPPGKRQVQRLRDERRRLEAALESQLGGELSGAPPSGVVIGIPARTASHLATEMMTTLVPEVRLTLRDLAVRKAGELHGKVVVARARLGTYVVDVHLDEVKILLRPGRPRFAFAGERVGVVLPISLAQGEGRGTVRFRWDGRGVAGAICGDLEATGAIAGTVLPAVHTAAGAFAIAAEAGALVARPEFPDLRIRLEIEPSPKTWQLVDATIKKQGALCRGALGVADVREKIRGVVGKGFAVTVPGKLLPVVRFPAALRGEAELAGRFEMTPVALSLSRGWLWYGADVTLRKP